jgi:hypothetical protein
VDEIIPLKTRSSIPYTLTPSPMKSFERSPQQTPHEFIAISEQSSFDVRVEESPKKQAFLPIALTIDLQNAGRNEKTTLREKK